MANATYPNIFKIAMAAYLSGKTVKCLLLKTGYTHDPDHDFVDDLTPASFELTVSGYSRQEITNVAATLDTANNRCKIDGDDVTFTSLVAGETIVAAVAYVHLGADDAANPVLGYIDLADVATNGGNIVITWNAAGIETVS